MNKKALLVFAGIFIFLYILNYLTPMSFGDDYVYSFMWHGKAMSTPLPPDAVRISSWKELFASQWLHYFTWGGRAVAHVLIQFFLWMGKDVFNFFNTCVCTFLFAEIYFCMNRANIKLRFEAKKVFFIFVTIWAFTPAFSQVFFWVGGSLNYVWTTVFLLAFLIPYIRKYYSFFSQEKTNADFNALSMFIGGILAGWSNENTICWVILALFFFIMYVKRRKSDLEIDRWMYTGLAGLVIGYLLLMLAPGNANRFYLDYGNASFIARANLIENFKMAVLILLVYHFVLWYFCLRSFWDIKQKQVKGMSLKAEIVLVKIICGLSLGMFAIMIFSPEFPPRSAFQSTVFLVIACGILLRLQEEYQVIVVHKVAKKLFPYLGSIYFALTASITLYCFYNTHLQFRELLSVVQEAHISQDNNIIVIKPIKEPKDSFFWSGMHTITYVLSDDVSGWANVAFSKYYGIKGIRMVKNDKEVTE